MSPHRVAVARVSPRELAVAVELIGDLLGLVARFVRATVAEQLEAIGRPAAPPLLLEASVAPGSGSCWHLERLCKGERGGKGAQGVGNGGYCGYAEASDSLDLQVGTQKEEVGRATSG